MTHANRKRNRTLQQIVRIVVLTALVLLIQAGYLDLERVPFPQECSVTQTGTTQDSGCASVLEELDD